MSYTFSVFSGFPKVISGEFQPLLLSNAVNVTCEAKGKELPTFSWFLVDTGTKTEISTVSQYKSKL